ncbi:MAG: disulfide bond formation protein B [Parvibaculales bacterium]
MQTGFKTHALIITLAGTAILATALASEIWGGLTPCALCLQQRWPYYIALPLAALVWVGGDRAPIALQGLLVPVGVIFAAGAALGFYHAGVEYALWAGPSGCGGGSSGFETTADLFDAMARAKPVACDKAAFTLFGISMAGYNFLASSGLAVLAWHGAMRAMPQETPRETVK